MDKVLIIGPLGDYGGREIEAKLIALSLLNNYSLQVCSTGNITPKSQIYCSADQTNTTSLKKQIYKSYHFLKFASVMSFLRNKRKEPVYFYVNNKLNSRFNFRKKEIEQLQKLIDQVDLIFILAHLFTARTKEIIEIASLLNKKIIFRTTGTIEFKKSWPEYLKKVDLFIHHSQENAKILHLGMPARFTVIDQSAIQEKRLLKLTVLQIQVKNYAVIGRLSEEKNIRNLIAYFKSCSAKSDKLYIIGDGDLKTQIKKEIKDTLNIIMLGHLSSEETADSFKYIDCIIIPSYNEAGPFVGVEAMAAGKIILSTKVGAMVERLQDSHNDFWFQPEDMLSFKKQLERIKNLSPLEVHRIAEKNRNLYMQNYSTKEVSNKYKNSVSQLLHKSSKACS